MDNEILMLALNGLKKEVEDLKVELLELKAQLANVKEEPIIPAEKHVGSTMMDELIDTKSVLGILGISYNTLQAIVKKGLLIPLRISPKRIRFTRSNVNRYLKTLLD